MTQKEWDEHIREAERERSEQFAYSVSLLLNAKQRRAARKRVDEIDAELREIRRFGS